MSTLETQEIEKRIDNDEHLSHGARTKLLWVFPVVVLALPLWFPCALIYYAVSSVVMYTTNELN